LQHDYTCVTIHHSGIFRGESLIIPILIVIASCGLLLFLVESFSYLYYKRKSGSKKIVLEFLLDRKRVSPHAPEEQSASQSAPTRYAEHPFTGWSLNPDFINIHGKKIHNRQGFRCDFDFSQLETDDIRIYVGGESTVYCTDIEKNEDTWPVLLGNQLESRLGRKVWVINGGVGGYNSHQSFIRLSGFIEQIKPHAVLIYHHAKNDLTPFYNGPPSIENGNVMPDFSNLIRGLNFAQMSHSINGFAYKTYTGKILAMRNLSLQQLNILRFIYNMEGVYDAPKLLSNRFDLDMVKSFHKNIAGLCSSREIPMIYTTQLVRTKQFEPFLSQVNNSIRELENHERLCWICDLAGEFPRHKDLYHDKLHFTPKGCTEVAAFLADFFDSSGLSNRLKHVKTGNG
jgi:hypothetical protein